MANANGATSLSEFPSWKLFLGAVVAELVAGVLVVLQGVTVGLFSSDSSAFQLGSFLLHVVVLGPLPLVAAFLIAVAFPVPPTFVFGVAAAVLGSSLILICIQLLGGFPSSNGALVKFAVTAYGTWAACVYIWSYKTMREAGKSGLSGWKHVYGRAFLLGQEFAYRLMREGGSASERSGELPAEPRTQEES